MRSMSTVLRSREVQPPLHLYYIFLATALTSLALGLATLPVPVLSQNLGYRIAELSLGIFNEVVLGYILYLALRTLNLHRSEAEELLRKVRSLAEEQGVRSEALELSSRELGRVAMRNPLAYAGSFTVLAVLTTSIAGILPNLLMGISPLSEEFFHILITVAVLSFVLLAASIAACVLIFYILHVLNRDLTVLEYCEDAVSVALRTLGKIVPERRYRVPRRSTALYVVLSLITLGLFILYWVYAVIFKDYPRHLYEDLELYEVV